MLGDFMKWVLHFALWGYFVIEVLATKPNVCRTPGCVQAAEIFKKNMDPTVNPCDDFYSFACGNFVNTEKIPKDEKCTSSFTNMNDILTKQIQILLDNSPDHLNDPKPFKMARNLYYICLREDLIKERGVGFVVDMLKSAGGWPLLEGDNWDADKFDWVETVYKLHDLGLYGVLFDLTVHVNPANRFKYILVIDQVSLGLAKEYLIEGRSKLFVKAYESFMTGIAELFGANHTVSHKEIGHVLDFEIELAKICLSEKERQDFSKLYNPMQMNVLQAKYPIVNWDQYINYMMNNITRVRSDEVIIVNVPSYLDKLQVLLKNTDKRTLANYLIWKAISVTLGILTTAVRDKQSLYQEVLTGRIKKHEPRWKVCLGTTAYSLSLAVGAMYARKFFKKDAKGNAVEMVENIHGEMMNVLNSVDWMDEETRSKAIDKGIAMEKHIGYPNELLEDKKIEKFYEGLEINGVLFYESILNLTIFGWNYGVGSLRETINKTDWRTHGNAATGFFFYNPMENSVQFPAGIFQHVFFSHDRPKYMNYGAIGSVIAHEITHGFDLMGQKYDKFGNSSYWGNSKTTAAYFQKMDCFVKQANNYTVISVLKNLNGVNTQGQNAADSGGIKLSYSAYNSWAAKHQKEPRLVGLEKYTPQQMFWLSAANAWCTKYQEKALKMQLDTGYHPPAEYRVNGAMMNQEAFAKDFQCPVGSSMNPAKKCNVW